MKPIDTTEEKRDYRRLPKEIPLEINTLTYPLPKEWGDHCRGKDISAGGICFVSSTPYHPGTVLSLKLNIQGWDVYKKPHAVIVDISRGSSLHVIGEVVWCRNTPGNSANEVGIKFLDIYEDDRRALIKYLNDLS